jgi:hypothetical protein
MIKSRSDETWDLAEAIVLLSPVIVIFSIPLAIGLGLDVFCQCGEVPFALALCAPLAFVLLRLFPPRALARHLATLQRPSLTRSSELNYAPGSIG